jgi:predicted DNA-binding transcriptional regulator YafY
MADDDAPTRRISLDVMRAGAACLRYLRDHGGRATKATLADHCGCSVLTVQRALDWLRDDHQAPVVFDRSSNEWTLARLDFSLPLFDPSLDDLAAVTFAAELLAPVVGQELNDRIERVREAMDWHVRKDQRSLAPRNSAVTATITSGQQVEPRVVSTLLGAARRNVVRIRYASPWLNSVHTYEVEPWQLRIHDGTWYLRAWSRTSSGARTFRVVQIQACELLDGLTPLHTAPPAAELWGDDGLGVDEDRPDIAVVEIRGPFARWVAYDSWHPAQVDEWLEQGELLRRTVRYRSCREFARRLLSLGDALGRVEPAALRGELAAHAAALMASQGC